MASREIEGASANSYTAMVGARLRATRENMNLNQAQFAELGGVKRSSQILYEGGDRYPDTLYFQKLRENNIDIEHILCANGATESLNPAPGVLQRIFMISAEIEDPGDPRVELFQTLCAACAGRTNPGDAERIFKTLLQFRRVAG